MKEVVFIKIPRHIGIIPDGNRRWAEESGKERHEGYHFGLLPGLELLRAAREYGIEEITYYGFTTDNCKRPAVQLAAFSEACVNAVKLISSESVSLLVVGNHNSSAFPPELIPFTKRQNVNGGGIKVNFLVNYGWEWDLAGLAGDLGSRAKIQDKLRSADVSRVDLIIRWGGMRRLSGFLPVQAVYADFYVVKNYWPDYKVEDFHEAISWYARQDATLGG